MQVTEVERDRGPRITKVERDARGHWTANIGGLPVTCRYGSWTTVPDESGRCREILPAHARRLAERVRREARAEGRGEVAA